MTNRDNVTYSNTGFSRFLNLGVCTTAESCYLVIVEIALSP